MDIKYVLGALVIILLLGNIFFISGMQSPSGNVVMVGEKSLKLPENYSATEIDISNGADKLIIYKVGVVDLDTVVKDYKDQFSENFTIDVKDFNSNLPAKKTVALNSDNSSIVKYWFKADNTVYQIQVSNKNDAAYDSIVKNMINSIK